MASICRHASLFNRPGPKFLTGWSAFHNAHLVRLQSDQASNRKAGSDDTKKKPFEKLDLTFSDTKEAYKSKRTSELIRACLVLKLSSFNYLVQNHEKVMKEDFAIFNVACPD